MLLGTMMQSSSIRLTLSEYANSLKSLYGGRLPSPYTAINYYTLSCLWFVADIGAGGRNRYPGLASS